MRSQFQFCMKGRGGICLRTDRTYDPFRLMALCIPAAEAAVGKNWLPTLILALTAVLVCTWVNALQLSDVKWLHRMQALGAAFLLSGFLEQTYTSWPGQAADYVVPGVLLLLAAYAVWRGSAVQAASVLRYGVYLVLLAMTLFGIGQVKLEQLQPKAELPDMTLAAALLLPLLARKSKNWKIVPNGLFAVVASLLTAGSASLFEYSRGLSAGQAVKHIESLTACAVTIGWFAAICFILDGVKERENGDLSTWLIAVIAYAIHIAGIQIRPEAFVITELILWAVIPGLWALKEKMTKKRKTG